MWEGRGHHPPSVAYRQTYEESICAHLLLDKDVAVNAHMIASLDKMNACQDSLDVPVQPIMPERRLAWREGHAVKASNRP